MQTEIEVKYVNPPKEGKKWGSIKGADGQSFVGPPNTYQNIQPGQKVRVDWQPASFNADMKQINSVQALTSAPAPKETPFQQGTLNHATAVFITGIIGRTLQSTGSIPDQATIASMVKNLRLGFVEGMTGAKPTESGQMSGGHEEPPIDDEIPF